MHRVLSSVTPDETVWHDRIRAEALAEGSQQA